MARMRPKLTEHDLENLDSGAEVKFYLACRDQLHEKYLVCHSIRWTTQPSGRAAVDGEADFVIFDPNSGFIVVEIKGGGISYDTENDKWFTVNALNEEDEIKDPFTQATKGKYSILEKILDHHSWQSSGLGRLLAGHSVFFPDISELTPFINPQRPREIIGCRNELSNLQQWFDQVVEYWRNDDQRFDPLGNSGIRIIETIFSPPLHVRPLVSAQIADEEFRRIELTDQQKRILRSLGDRKRAAICGGAGTGKTLLAMHKAKKLADNGLKTVLLCYNRPLAEHLANVAGDYANLEVKSFHQFCGQQCRDFNELNGKDLLEEAEFINPNGDKYKDWMPEALAKCSEDDRFLYDAIIVDESQDFTESYWIALEILLKENGYLYVFFDTNQAIYQECTDFPVNDDPYFLTINCRNTKHIHDAAYKFYHGEPIDPPEIQGVEVLTISGHAFLSQMIRLHSEIVSLLTKQDVTPDDIAILIPGQSQDIFIDNLKKKPLPRGVHWAFGQRGEPNSIVVETVRRFKGLEKQIVFWAGLDEYNLDTDFETAYVALSRAKSRLYLVGSEDNCQRVLNFTLESVNG